MHNIQLTNKSNLSAAFLTFLLLFISASACAKDYKVEVIIFENNEAAPATEQQDYQPPRKMTTNSETWELEPSMLLEQFEALKVSPKYAARYYLSWGQESLRYQDSATFEIRELDAQGFIKVYAEQLLFANIDLDYDGYRLQEKRRLKLDEKHYFDHPKFGILMQVSRLPAETDQEAEQIGNRIK